MKPKPHRSAADAIAGALLASSILLLGACASTSAPVAPEIPGSTLATLEHEALQAMLAFQGEHMSARIQNRAPNAATCLTARARLKAAATALTSPGDTRPTPRSSSTLLCMENALAAMDLISSGHSTADPSTESAGWLLFEDAIANMPR